MRLRQVALASRRLDEVVGELEQAFGLKVAYNDPGIIHYGLRNAVLPAGDGFLEVVEPVRPDASAGRFIDRRGGDAGYMVILQVADAEAERRRAVALGVRVVDDLENKSYRAVHFHPADFGGVLVSFDQQRTEADPLTPHGDWWPAGPDWRAARSDRVTALKAVVMAAADPATLARRWSELLGRPLSDDGLRIALDRGEIRFEAAEAGEPTRLAAVELQTADAAAASEATIGGVRFLVA